MSKKERNVEEMQAKAKQVLRARLPQLADAGLNFEKRTGNFFIASLVTEKVKDANGEDTERDALGADGRPIEKVRRLVVDIVGDDGALLPKYAECADEIEQKRAAALVEQADKLRERLEEIKETTAKAYSEADAELAKLEDDLVTATALVMSVELPERAPRATATIKLAKVEDENAKLRAQLIAMGIDPDTLV